MLRPVRGCMTEIVKLRRGLRSQSCTFRRKDPTIHVLSMRSRASMQKMIAINVSPRVQKVALRHTQLGRDTSSVVRRL